MTLDARTFVAGHGAWLDRRLMRLLQARGATTHPDRDARSTRSARPGSGQLLVQGEPPRYVYLVAGTVGGILANSTRPAEFIYDNMLIHATVVHAAHQYRRRRSCFISGAPASTPATASSRWSRTIC